eukprot:4014494-Prymnesium_polylepis.2
MACAHSTSDKPTTVADTITNRGPGVGLRVGSFTGMHSRQHVSMFMWFSNMHLEHLECGSYSLVRGSKNSTSEADGREHALERDIASTGALARPAPPWTTHRHSNQRRDTGAD